jgi:hypothetical protein
VLYQKYWMIHWRGYYENKYYLFLLYTYQQEERLIQDGLSFSIDPIILPMLDKAWNLVLRKVMLNHFYLFSYAHRLKKSKRTISSKYNLS